MNMRSVLGIVALVPALFNGAVPAQAEILSLALCSGRTIEVPLQRRRDAPVPDAPCCAKACHTGQTRKRGCC